MKRITPFFLAVALVWGCSSSPSDSDIPEATYGAMKQLRIGMRDGDAVSLMRPVSADWGRVYWGGGGAGRVYFQVSRHQQMWVEVSGSPDFLVTEISPLEPKAKWTRFSGDSITVQ
jgi:hypothetical protein